MSIEVKKSSSGEYMTGLVTHTPAYAVMTAHQLAAHYTAIADYIDAEREAAEVAELEALKAKIEAEKKLYARRDAIADYLTGDKYYRYTELSEFSRCAIDRIIELEDELAESAKATFDNSLPFS